MHQACQQDTCGLAKEQRRAEEAQGRAGVHGGARHVEREARHHLLFEHAKVVAQERAADAEAPGRSDDENVAKGQQRVGRSLRVDVQQERVRRLLSNGRLVEPVADDAEGKDCRGERVVGYRRVAAKELGEELVAIFYSLRRKMHVSQIPSRDEMYCTTCCSPHQE